MTARLIEPRRTAGDEQGRGASRWALVSRSVQRMALFDLDDTLVDRRRGFQVRVHDFVTGLGLGLDAEGWLLEAMADRAYREDFEAFRHAFHLESTSAELWSGYVTHMAEATPCPDGVLADLDDLRRDGWRVAVVTNGAADIQHAKLARTGIAGVVDAVCVSEEVGVRKPDAAIFDRVASLCGLDLRGGGWMVGDNVVNDIEGARAVGLRTIWISDCVGGDQQPADFVTADIREAIAFLKALPGMALE